MNMTATRLIVNIIIAILFGLVLGLYLGPDTKECPPIEAVADTTNIYNSAGDFILSEPAGTTGQIRAHKDGKAQWIASDDWRDHKYTGKLIVYFDDDSTIPRGWNPENGDSYQWYDNYWWYAGFSAFHPISGELIEKFVRGDGDVEKEYYQKR